MFGIIIMMSICFEEFQSGLYAYLRQHNKKSYIKMCDALFKELTILGFVGLSLMALVKSGLLGGVAHVVFPQLHDLHMKQKAEGTGAY